MEYKVALTRQADNDLVRIWKYISKDSPLTATSFCLELERQAYSLKVSPGRTAELATRPDVRKIPYKNYLIFTGLLEDTRTVEILRFWHAARDQRRLRLKEDAAPTYEAAKVGA